MSLRTNVPSGTNILPPSVVLRRHRGGGGTLVIYLTPEGRARLEHLLAERASGVGIKSLEEMAVDALFNVYDKMTESKFVEPETPILVQESATQEVFTLDPWRKEPAATPH